MKWRSARPKIQCTAFQKQGMSMLVQATMEIYPTPFYDQTLELTVLLDLVKRYDSYLGIEFIVYIEEDRESVKEQYELDCLFWRQWGCEPPYTLEDEFEDIEDAIYQLIAHGVTVEGYE